MRTRTSTKQHIPKHSKKGRETRLRMYAPKGTPFGVTWPKCTNIFYCSSKKKTTREKSALRMRSLPWLPASSGHLRWGPMTSLPVMHKGPIPSISLKYNFGRTHILLILFMQYLLYILTKFDIPFLPISYLCNAYCIYCLDWTFRYYRSPVNAVFIVHFD